MAYKYCSSCFKTGEELDEALVAALECCNNADRAESARVEAEDVLNEIKEISKTASIEAHNVDDTAHADIRALIENAGNGLPDHTTADNGKFLRIVDGVPAWATVQNAEEVSF